MKRDPYVLALITCDGVHRDPWTGKKTFLGARWDYQFQRLPAEIPELVVHAEVTDCVGDVELRARIHDVDGGVLREVSARTECGDPLLILDVDFEFHAVPIESEGDYHVELLYNGMTVMLRRISVLVSQPGDDDE